MAMVWMCVALLAGESAQPSRHLRLGSVVLAPTTLPAALTDSHECLECPHRRCARPAANRCAAAAAAVAGGARRRGAVAAPACERGTPASTAPAATASSHRRLVPAARAWLRLEPSRLSRRAALTIHLQALAPSAALLPPVLMPPAACFLPPVADGDVPLPSPPPRFNVRDFGAKGDGVTDDTQAIMVRLLVCLGVRAALARRHALAGGDRYCCAAALHCAGRAGAGQQRQDGRRRGLFPRWAGAVQAARVWRVGNGTSAGCLAACCSPGSTAARPLHPACNLQRATTRSPSR